MSFASICDERTAKTTTNTNMTLSKHSSSRSEEPKYDPHKPKPSTVNLGVSLITIETYTIIQDDKAVSIPVDDDIYYLTVDRKLIQVPNESSIKYDVVAELLEAEGYPRRLWKIMHCWECIPPDQEPF